MAERKIAHAEMQPPPAVGGLMTLKKASLKVTYVVIIHTIHLRFNGRPSALPFKNNALMTDH